MSRVTFLVDGFNLYHSAKEASRDLGGRSTKWLDLRGLLRSYLPVIGSGALIEDVYYFTAQATHMDSKKSGTTARHRLYMECLSSTGVRIVMGRFKYKTVWCERCRTATGHYEEKESDVAMSTTLLEIFHNDECDTAILVTGDTDLAPAIRAATRLFPSRTVGFAFPYKRKNSELAKLTSTSFRLRKERYEQHQFPDPVVLPTGRKVRKPAQW